MYDRRTLKVVLIGDGGVGKTSVRHNFMSGGAFAASYKATIGADFITRSLPLSPSQPDGPRVTLSVWDTAGQERFQALGAAFYRGADAVIIMFDASKGKSELERVRFWKEEFAKRTPVRAGGETRRFAWLCVGNKADLTGADAAPGVTESEAREFLDGLLPRKPGPGGPSLAGSGAQEPAKPRDVLARPEPTMNAEDLHISTDVSVQRPTTRLDEHCAPSPHLRSVSHDKAISNHHVSKSSSTEAIPPSHSLRSRLSLRSLKVNHGDGSKRQGTLRVNGKRNISSATANNAAGHISSPAPSTPEQLSAETLGRNRVDSTVSQISLLSHGASVYHTPRTSTYFAPSTPPSRSTRDSSPSRESSRTVNGRTPRDSGASTHSEAARSALDTVAQRDEQRPGRPASSSPTRSDRSVAPTVTGEVLTPTAGVPSSSATTTREITMGSGDDHEPDSAHDFALIAPANAFLSGDPIPFPSTEDDEFDDDEQHAGAVGNGVSSFHPKMDINNHRSGGRGWLESLKTSKGGVLNDSTHKDSGSMSTSSFADADRYGTLKSIPPEEIRDGLRPSTTAPLTKGRADAKTGRSSRAAVSTTIPEPDAAQADEAPDVEEGFTLLYTSAKTGQNVRAVFEHVVSRVRSRWALEEWEERERGRERAAAALGIPYAFGGKRAPGAKGGSIRLPRNSLEEIFAPPSADRERHEEQIRRGIRIAAGKDPDPGKGGWRSCCS